MARQAKSYAAHWAYSKTKWQSFRQLLMEGEQRGDADYDLEHFIHVLDRENAR